MSLLPVQRLRYESRWQDLFFLGRLSCIKSWTIHFVSTAAHHPSKIRASVKAMYQDSINSRDIKARQRTVCPTATLPIPPSHLPIYPANNPTTPNKTPTNTLRRPAFSRRPLLVAALPPRHSAIGPSLPSGQLQLVCCEHGPTTPPPPPPVAGPCSSCIVISKLLPLVWPTRSGSTLTGGAVGASGRGAEPSEEDDNDGPSVPLPARVLTVGGTSTHTVDVYGTYSVETKPVPGGAEGSNDKPAGTETPGGKTLHAFAVAVGVISGFDGCIARCVELVAWSIMSVVLSRESQ